MSDRVAIIGGSEVGRDHFPAGTAPTVDLPVLTGEKTINPIGVDVGTMSRWFYLVRVWHFSTTFGGTIETGPPIPFSVTIEFDFEWLLTNDGQVSYYQANRESDLVISRTYPAFVTWSDFEDSTNTIDENGGVIITNYSSDNSVTSFAFTFEFSPGLPWWKTSLFWPEMRFAIDRTGRCSSYNDLPNLIGSFSVESENTPVYANNGVNAVPHVVFTSCATSVTPKTFWSYASKADGSPIYDTASGAQLQSPFN